MIPHSGDIMRVSVETLTSSKGISIRHFGQSVFDFMEPIKRTFFSAATLFVRECKADRAAGLSSRATAFREANVFGRASDL